MLKNIFKSNKVVDPLFEEGKTAFWNDAAATDNPYEHSDKERAQRWESGWNNAQRTNESLKKKWEAPCNEARKTSESLKKNLSSQSVVRETFPDFLSRLAEDFLSGLAGIVGVVTFFGCWIYAVATYGWFLGLSFGWIPSMIIAGIATLLSPIIAILLLIGVVVLFVVLSKSQA